MKWGWRTDIISEMKGLGILYGALFVAFFTASLWDVFNTNKTLVGAFWISAGLSLVVIIMVIFVLLVQSRDK